MVTVIGPLLDSHPVYEVTVIGPSLDHHPVYEVTVALRSHDVPGGLSLLSVIYSSDIDHVLLTR